MYFNTFEPSLLKTITIQSNIGWTTNILKHISPYFQPLIPLLNVLRERIVIPMANVNDSFSSCEEPITSDDMVNHILKVLGELPAWCWVACDPPYKDESQRPTPAMSSASVPPVDSALQSSNSENAANSSSEDTSSCSEYTGTRRMSRPSAIRRVTGPGFTSLIDSSGSRRQPPESDAEYIESNPCQKHPRFEHHMCTVQTRQGPLTPHRFAVTQPTSDLFSHNLQGLRK